MRYLLGVDVGSYSTKGVLLSLAGDVVAIATQSHDMSIPAPGWAEHDAVKDWWGGFTSVTRQLLTQTGIDATQIASVGCSGIGPCMLPLNQAGEPLRPAVLYGVDVRAQLEMAEMTERYGLSFLLQHSGGSLTTQAVGPKIAWFAKNEPELFAQTAHIVGCPSYLVYRLTGRMVIDHYGGSNYLPFYDIEKQCWSKDIIKDTCSPDLLPELAWSSEIAGYISNSAALETGLAEGTPVIVGTIDSAAEAASVGVFNTGDLMVQYGTSIFFIQVLKELHRDERHWSAPYLFPNTWAAMGGVSTGGALTHWFGKLLGFDRNTRDDALSILANEALKSPPGANGLIVLPYFSGERTPINDPNAKGMFFGLNLSHERADLYRALLEGIGHATRHNLDMLDEVSPASFVSAVGGGIHNHAWIQSSVDISAKPHRIRKYFIGASLGSAFLAGIGVNVLKLEDIGCINPIERTLEPQQFLKELYDKDHEIYLELYHSTKSLMCKL